MFRFLLALGVVATISAPLQALRGRGSLGPGDRVRIASDEVSGEFSVVDERASVLPSSDGGLALGYSYSF